MKTDEKLPRRVVLDTNVLIGAAYAPNSASRWVVDACLRGELAAVVSPALLQEYDMILRQAVRVRSYDAAIGQLLREAAVAEPTDTPRVVANDPADDKLIAAALAGSAVAIVTNDRHLLDLDPYDTLRIVRPTDFVRRWLGHGTVPT